MFVCLLAFYKYLTTDYFNLQLLEEEKQNVGGEKEGLKEEMETLKKEQDDLLVLLADQDAKIERYKVKLKDLGQEVCTIYFTSSYKVVPYGVNDPGQIT